MSPTWFAFSAVVAACGIPQEEHDKALADQKTLYEQKLAEMQKAAAAEEKKRDDQLKTQGNQISVLETEVKRLGGNLTEVSARAETLGQQVGQAKAELQATAQELEQLRKQREQAEKMASTFRKLAADLKAMVDAGQLSVGIREGRMTLNLPDNILFPSGSAQLKKDGQQALMQVAEVLKTQEGRDFLVAGHTDNVPLKRGSNWELSTARALTVVQLLIKAGVKPEHLAAAGFGEFDPVAFNDNEAERAKNRRIEIVLLPRLDELPSIPELSAQ